MPQYRRICPNNRSILKVTLLENGKKTKVCVPGMRKHKCANSLPFSAIGAGERLAQKICWGKIPQTSVPATPIMSRDSCYFYLLLIVMGWVMKLFFLHCKEIYLMTLLMQSPMWQNFWQFPSFWQNFSSYRAGHKRYQSHNGEFRLNFSNGAFVFPFCL